jgi:hypothetical protein
MLDEAAPRDESEAVVIELTVPGLTGDAANTSMTVRRGFVGVIHMLELPGEGYEGRTLISVVIRGWNGDTPVMRWERQPV